VARRPQPRPDSSAPAQDLRPLTKQLGAWFLGPKAENAFLEEEMILYILRDYFHWRRNYYPSDEILITQRMHRESVDWNDALLQQISDMLARLRRHFPFYSPRYIGHMLSDQTIPSVLGYFAGMLYNPNNVTPEAAPVTVEWELEVARDILSMLGYRSAPPEGSSRREFKREFGWAHLTSGGTVANIEALWIARNVRYFPLAVREAACRERIPLTIKLPGSKYSTPQLITDLDERTCLGVRPNEAIYLMTRFVEAVRHHYDVPAEEAVTRAWDMLAACDYSVMHKGVATAFRNHPPALFVSGTAHYCLGKAADLLGLGRENIVLVDVDKRFRLDLRDLEHRFKVAQRRGQVPLAVVGIAGTTEEGAIDPIHEIAQFRRRLEAQQGQSFWLHIDAAWGGYIRSLFVPGEGEGESETQRQSNSGEQAGAGDVPERTKVDARIEDVNRFTSRPLTLEHGRYRRTVEMRWGSKQVCNAFLAFPSAESIAVDPHKMGYVPYPSGVVAFRNDRVRHFIAQDAPYITSTTPKGAQLAVHQPPTQVGSFILEGSKPGAAAASCWLSHRMIPPTRKGYGEIVRASLLGARELYERLIHWEDACRVNKIDTSYEFVPITKQPPDTNIVCFLIKEKGSRSLERMNEVSRLVYERFTIQAELGDREYSYLQPYFLSRTRFHVPQYSVHAVQDLLQRLEVPAEDYLRHGLFILRATVMTPYIVLAAETGRSQSHLADFMQVLAKRTEEAVVSVQSKSVKLKEPTSGLR
jgi:glutamate/tyrosine decarboxylase-like PLP-dependent enzyme